MTDSLPDAATSARDRANGVALEWCGRGEPLLLIHGTGGSRFHWHPVVQRLRQRRRLLVVDLPGHGESAPLAPGVPNTPTGYAAALAQVLSERGLDTLDICGHSAGAWTALELAKLGRAKSVVAVAPAGLWGERDPWSHVVKLAVQYMTGRAFAPVTPALLRRQSMRAIFMSRSFARPRQIEPADAIALAQTFARTPGLLAHLGQTRKTRFRGGRDLTVPVTVVWGDSERLIPAEARLPDELPAGTRFITLEDCGHMAAWDDPEGISGVILRATGGAENVEDLSGGWEDLV